ncbi:MAG: sigma-70 family RNA polymerase sigma factor [Actinobacteria bacterium]|nr:sigma-70 family RNA polymerase sigma factor [Actinomycetota bacterium]
MRPFEQVVVDHGPVVLRVCRAVIGPNEAEDVWSETFLSALGAYPDLRPGTNIEAWLVTIAKRKAIDRHRARARGPVPVENLPDMPAPVQDKPGSRENELWQALRELPSKQREAVAYHYIAGMPYAQVAEILGNSEAAARRAAADGIKRFRATYKGELS